jgi:hypothetical protein
MRTILGKMILAPVVMAAAALAANTAMAESRVNVPFNFTVGGKQCPAGAYSVIGDATHNRVILMSKNTPLSFTWLLSAGDAAPMDTKVALRFGEQGQNFTLQSVQYHSLTTHRLDKAPKHSEHANVRVVEGE